jgi:hypothetical protein
LGTVGYVSTATLNMALSSFSSAIGTIGSQFVIPSTVSTVRILTSSLFASTVTASSIFTSSITGSLSQFAILSSMALTVSSFFTATRQATPMFITF